MATRVLDNEAHVRLDDWDEWIHDNDDTHWASTEEVDADREMNACAHDNNSRTLVTNTKHAGRKYIGSNYSIPICATFDQCTIEFNMHHTSKIQEMKRQILNALECKLIQLQSKDANVNANTSTSASTSYI